MPEQLRVPKPARDDSKHLSAEQARQMAREHAERQHKEHEDRPSGHTDEVLADVDEALKDLLANETAEEFVRSYRQKGGE